MTRRMLIFAATAALVLAASAGTALAQGQEVCIKPANPVVAPGSNGCPKSYTSQVLATESEVTALQDENTTLKARVDALEATLSKVSYSATGLNGLPTLKIDGANLQIVNGSGATGGTVNGLGNVIIGYDESPGTQTGSHNLILGTNQTFTSYAGMIGGRRNVLSGPFSAVFGYYNTASGNYASVSGGYYNTASGNYASGSGGIGNTASGIVSSVSGGGYNTASGTYASVSGGIGNTASGTESSVSGGDTNTASGPISSILGGDTNTVDTLRGTWPAGP